MLSVPNRRIAKINYVLLSICTHRINLKLSSKYLCIGTMNSTYHMSEAVLFAHGPIVRVINTLRPRQNGRRFADDTFKRIFLNENVIISIKISLKFVPKGPINNNPALVQIMAWRRSGDKPLSEPMTVSLLSHICVTRPQWVKLRMTYSCDECINRYCPDSLIINELRPNVNCYKYANEILSAFYDRKCSYLNSNFTCCS